MKTPVLALAALSLASVGAAQVTRSGAGYDIKVKYAPGKTYNYNLATGIRMSGGQPGQAPPPAQTINIRLMQRVLSVKNGIATLRVQSTGGPGGNTQPQTVQVNNRGKVLGGQNANSGFNFLTGFPNRPVKVGERWTSTTPMPMGPMGRGNANVAYVFRGLKTVGGRQAAQIDFSINMAGQAKMKGSGTAFLAVTDGQLISSTMKGNLTFSAAAMGGQPRPGAKPMQIAVNVNMKRAG